MCIILFILLLFLMIQTESIVHVVDNTWVRLWLVFGIIKWNARHAGIGDIVNIAIKQADPSSSFKKGWTSRAIVVRTVNKIRRPDGSYIKFEDNAVALVNKENQPVGKRIFGPVAKELREKWFRSIANLAAEVI